MSTDDNYDRITDIMQLVCELVTLVIVNNSWFLTEPGGGGGGFGGCGGCGGDGGGFGGCGCGDGGAEDEKPKVCCHLIQIHDTAHQHNKPNITQTDSNTVRTYVVRMSIMPRILK